MVHECKWLLVTVPLPLLQYNPPSFRTNFFFLPLTEKEKDIAVYIRMKILDKGFVLASKEKQQAKLFIKNKTYEEINLNL